MSKSSRIPGFYRLSVQERLERLRDNKDLSDSEVSALGEGGLSPTMADHMVENVVGTYSLPLALGLNFLVDDVDYLVPMVIEEASVVAAASNAARMVRAGGGFSTEVSRPVMIGQVQLLDVPDPDAARAAIDASKPELLDTAATLCPGVVSRGGGPVDIETRHIPDPDAGSDQVIVHVLIDCVDAMGANLVNTVAEGLSSRLAELSGGRVGLRILSNLSVHRTVTVTARVPHDALAESADAGAAARNSIVSASRFAELDPYRAATHNKGIMNGVDAALLAAGQDWRSVEAGAHAFAGMGDSYKPLAVWRSEGTELIGRLHMPLAVGTVGGALHIHPLARLSLSILAVKSAAELAKVVACVGLASNLAALRALATEGIQRGHMSLHARLVARAAGATGDLVERVAAEIAAVGDVKPERAKEILTRLSANPAARSLTLTDDASPCDDDPPRAGEHSAENRAGNEQDSTEEPA